MRPPRIAVTGVGIVSALGSDAPSAFSALFAGQRGILPVTLFDVDGQRSKLAAEVRGLAVADVAPRGKAEEWSRSDALAVLAARQALAMASAPAAEPLGLAIGATTGGMYEAETALAVMHAGGEQDAVRRLLSYPLSTSAERVAQAVGSVRHHATVCSACSSGANAIVLGAAWLRAGRCRRVLAGGTDGLCRLTFAGFNALGATDPEPCRPFDLHRAGLNLGEGAAFLVLETEADAVRRDAPVLAWFDGWAVGAEAHHVTHPEPSGDTATRLIREALGRAGVSPAELDYVNAHGTATPQNDAAEALALNRALGDEVRRVWVSSSKAQVGHTLGAAGAMEAAFSVLALSRGEIPPTAGLDHPDPVAPLRHVRHRGKAASLRTALSTSFGFGGTDSVLVFSAPRFPNRQPDTLAVRPLVVTAVASMGPLGRLANTDNAALADSGALEMEAGDPLALLEAGRSRRFDQASALATAGAETMLARRGRTGAGVGLALGSAFGNVDRSVHFLQRLFERGPRFVSPAEFPHLVPSAPSGNASIYLGLTGPVVGVSELEASAESSFAVAVSFLELGIAEAMIAGGAEPQDPVVDRVLAPLHVEAAVPASGRPGGAAWLLLEADSGGAALAEVALLTEAPSGSRLELASEPQSGAVVLSGLPPEVLDSVLAGSGWALAPRKTLHAALGRAEARGGYELAAAAALVARGDAPEVLVVGGARGWAFATLLRKHVAKGP